MQPGRMFDQYLKEAYSQFTIKDKGVATSQDLKEAYPQFTLEDKGVATRGRGRLCN